MKRRTVALTAVAIAGMPAAMAAAQGWVTFQNETSSRLVSAPGLGASDPEEKDLAYADLDNDGDIDLIVVRKQPFTNPTGKRNVLFMNEGGVLVDRTIEYATDSTDGSQGFLDITNDRDVAIGDVNGDGWLDFVTCPALNANLAKTISHPRVYLNLGEDEQGNWLGFIYDEARIPEIQPDPPNGCGIALGDVTGDGFPEIYVVNYNSSVNDRLLINDGTGFYSDQTSQRMTTTMVQSGFGTSGVILDIDGDGVNDIAKSENGPFKTSYNNPANEGFFNQHETASGGAHYGMSAGDLNNDGKIDFVLGDDGSDRFLLNIGNGADGMADFQSKTFSFLSGGDDGFGNNSRIVDLNNDGWNDVLIADVDVDIGGCSRRLHLYRNLGNAPSVTLQDQGTGGIPSGSLTGTHDVAVFDVNGDGWNDLVIGRCAGLSIWINVPPIGLVVSYPSGLPAFVTPDAETTFQVRLEPVGDASVLAGSERIVYTPEGGSTVESQLTPIGGGIYTATLPALACTQSASWHVVAQLVQGGTFTDPPTAPNSTYSVLAADGTEITLRDEMEEDLSEWTVLNHVSLTGGAWVAVDPNGTAVAGQIAQPEDDATTEGTMAWVTGNGAPGAAAGSADLDGGPTVLLSPTIDLEGQDGILSFSGWYFCDDPFPSAQNDPFQIFLSNDNGESWVLAEEITANTVTWKVFTFRVSDFLAPTAQVRVRFLIADAENNSITEAGVDNFQVETILCPGDACLGDIDGNGTVDGADLGAILGAWGTASGDLTGDGVVDGADLGVLLGAWGDC